MTRRLMQATVLLLVALGLALAARWTFIRGDHVASLSLAVLGLLFCCGVAYWSAPVFARWMRMKRIRLPWSYGLTRQGLFFIVAVGVVALGALSSGNNLLYLILSCMLAAMVVSGLVSRLGLSGLQLSLSFPPHLFAGRPTVARISLRNLKRWIPTFSIWLSVAPRPDHEPYVEMESVYCPLITGGGEARISVSATFLRRGRFQQGDFWLRSRFPFAFVERRARLRLTQEALVYPSVDDSAEVERWIEPVAEAWQSIVRGDSHDLYRIRPATPDDGARFVDWKATARSTGLMVREFTREDRRQVEVVFDPVQPRGPDSDEQFEKAVQMCAALVWRLHEMAAEVRFCSGEMGITIPAHSQRIYEVLQWLAVVQPVAEGRVSDVAPAQAASGNWGYRFVFKASGQASPALQSSQGCDVLFEQL